MAIALILAMVIIPAIGGIYVARGKTRTLRRLEAGMDADVRNRLTALGRQVQGTVAADGKSLDTPRGTMTLSSSQAPEKFVIDVAKFAGKTSLRGFLTVVRLEDAGKVLATRNLQVLHRKDPKMAERYHVLVSDVDQGDRWAGARLAEALQTLEAAVRARCRLQVAHEIATLLVFRGLTAEDLKPFYDAAVRILDVLNGSA